MMSRAGRQGEWETVLVFLTWCGDTLTLTRALSLPLATPPGHCLILSPHLPAAQISAFPSFRQTSLTFEIDSVTFQYKLKET